MKYNLYRQKHSAAFKGFTLKDNLLRNTQASKVYLHVDLNQIHEIIHKSLERKTTVSQTHRKSVSAVTKFINLHKDIKNIKRLSSPSMYKPFKVRCHSNVLKIKFTKPKLIAPCNNFIVKQLRRPEELSSPNQVAL